MIIVVSSVLITKNNRVLLVKENKMDKYGLPGGKLEPGESLNECAEREAHEELGAIVKLGDLVMVSEKPKTREGNTVLRYIFKSTIDNYDTKPELDSKYFSKKEFERLVLENKVRGKDVEQLINSFFEGKTIALPKPTTFA